MLQWFYSASMLELHVGLHTSDWSNSTRSERPRASPSSLRQESHEVSYSHVSSSPCWPLVLVLMSLIVSPRKSLEALHLAFHLSFDSMRSMVLMLWVWWESLMNILAVRLVHLPMSRLSSLLFHDNPVHNSVNIVFDIPVVLQVFYYCNLCISSLRFFRRCYGSLWWFMKIFDGFLGPLWNRCNGYVMDFSILEERLILQQPKVSIDYIFYVIVI